MKLIIANVTVAWVLLGGASAFAQDTDLQALQGTWRGWVVEGRGERPDAGPVNLEITVQKDVIVAKRLGGMRKDDPLGEGTFRLTVADKDKRIDATRTTAPAKGRTYAGIYEIAGDTLKWCVSNPNQERPTEMVTRRGQFLLILKRQ